MSSLAHLCRSTVTSLEGGIACCIYILDEDDSNTSPQYQAASGLVASYVRHPEYEHNASRFVEIALAALGPVGRSRLLPNSPKVYPGEFFLATNLWGFARLLSEKHALVTLLSQPVHNPNHGWATLSTMTSRLGSIL